MNFTHNSALIEKVAEGMIYERALANLSNNVDAERANEIMNKAMQTRYVVEGRTDKLLSGLDDEQMLQVIEAAMDRIAETAEDRKKRARRAQINQRFMKAAREHKEREALKVAAKNKQHLTLVQ